MKLNRLIQKVLVAICIIALFPLTPAAAETQTDIGQPAGPGSLRLGLTEADQWNKISRIISVENIGPGMPNEHNCSEVGQDACDFTNKRYASADSTLVAPVCETESQTNCLEGFSIFQTGQAQKPAKLIRHINAPTITPNEKFGITAGSSVSLWNAEGQIHGGGTSTYAVHPALNLEFNSKLKRFEVKGLSVSVVPYLDQSGAEYRQTSLGSGVTPEGRAQISILNFSPGCVWNDSGHCGLRQEFAPNARAQITLRVSNTVGGWFVGRLSDPNIIVEKLSPTTNKITVDAASVSVAQASVVVRRDTTSQAVKEFISKSQYPESLWAGGGGADTLSHSSAAFTFIDDVRELAGDKSVGVRSLWNLQSTQGGTGSRCLIDTSRVLGIVTTNSSVYERNAPAFIGGSLSYKVAGFHFLADGKTPVQGTYDLVMRSDVARCIYGFSQAPISATISVAGGTDKNVATTLVRENNGWLKLAAYGFTFSNKTIKVEITQPKVVKKTTITCVKGKLTKKVTAAGPKCPTGYKKK